MKKAMAMYVDNTEKVIKGLQETVKSKEVVLYRNYKKSYIILKTSHYYYITILHDVNRVNMKKPQNI